MAEGRSNTVKGSKLVRAYLAAHGDRVVLHYLPAYSPQDNPVERVWWHLHRAGHPQPPLRGHRRAGQADDGVARRARRVQDRGPHVRAAQGGGVTHVWTSEELFRRSGTEVDERIDFWLE